MSIKNQGIADIIGRPFTEEMDTQVSQYIGEHFVSKSDFNARKAQLDEAKTRLNELQTQLADQPAVDPEIQQKWQSALVNTHLDYAFSNAQSEKAKEAAKKMVDISKIEIGEDFTVSGLEDQVKAITESETYLFRQQEQSSGVAGRVFQDPAHPEGGDPPPANGADDAFDDPEQSAASKYMDKWMRDQLNTKGDDD